MHDWYVTDILKMCMKKFNALILICTLRGGGYSVRLACSQFLVITALKKINLDIKSTTSSFSEFNTLVWEQRANFSAF